MNETARPSLRSILPMRISSPRTRRAENLPERGNGDSTGGARATSLLKYAMWACCAAMALPFAAYFLSGGTLSGLTRNFAAFAPLLLCVGAHLVLCKLMGKSCHGGSGKEGSIAANEPGGARGEAETAGAPNPPPKLAQRSRP